MLPSSPARPSGIGLVIAERLADAGAKPGAADLDEEGSQNRRRRSQQGIRADMSPVMPAIFRGKGMPEKTINLVEDASDPRHAREQCGRRHHQAFTRAHTRNAENDDRPQSMDHAMVHLACRPQNEGQGVRPDRQYRRRLRSATDFGIMPPTTPQRAGSMHDDGAWRGSLPRTGSPSIPSRPAP